MAGLLLVSAMKEEKLHPFIISQDPVRWAWEFVSRDGFPVKLDPVLWETHAIQVGLWIRGA